MDWTAVNVGVMNALGIVLTAAIPVIATYAINVLRVMAARHGIELKQERLVRLDQMLVNGLNAAASVASGRTSKEDLKQQALLYVKEHGPELLNDLKADLSNPQVQEAMRARIETLIVDPTKPTPPVLDGKH